MKIKFSYLFTLLFLIGVLGINFAVTEKTFARGEVWNVSCRYDSNGNFQSGGCTTGGEDACSCPKSILGEN